MFKNTSRLQCVIPNSPSEVSLSPASSSINMDARNPTFAPAAPPPSPTDPNIDHITSLERSLVRLSICCNLIQGLSPNDQYYSAQISCAAVLISQISMLCWNISKKTISWYLRLTVNVSTHQKAYKQYLYILCLLHCSALPRHPAHHRFCHRQTQLHVRSPLHSQARHRHPISPHACRVPLKEENQTSWHLSTRHSHPVFP